MSESVRTALAVAVGARVPVLLWGGAGLGKSSAVREMAAGADLPCETAIASIREPSDFAGLPIVADDGKAVSFAPPSWAERLSSVGGGVLFLDEISTAPPAVQAVGPTWPRRLARRLLHSPAPISSLSSRMA